MPMLRNNAPEFKSGEPSRNGAAGGEPRVAAHRLLQPPERFGSVSTRFRITDYFRYEAILSYDEGHPLDQLEHEKIRDLDSVQAAELKVGVGEQIERKTLCQAESDVCVRRVGADAEDDGIVLFKLPEKFAEPASLRGSAGCSLTGEEKKHDVLPADEIIQADDPAILRARVEARRRAAYGQHLLLLQVGVGIGVATGIGIRSHEWPLRRAIDASCRLIPTAIPIPIVALMPGTVGLPQGTTISGVVLPCVVAREGRHGPVTLVAWYRPAGARQAGQLERGGHVDGDWCRKEGEEAVRRGQHPAV